MLGCSSEGVIIFTSASLFDRIETKLSPTRCHYSISILIILSAMSNKQWENLDEKELLAVWCKFEHAAPV
jgi:hypothetical protein